MLVECAFLIPSIRDSDRRPHSEILWRHFSAELIRLFGGGQGPRHRLFMTPEIVPGGWVPPGEHALIVDGCWEFRVALDEERLDELRGLLQRVARSFDQREIYLSVRGFVEGVGPGEEAL